MKKVLWYSDRNMTVEQKKALGECEIMHVHKHVNTAYELINEIKTADVIAVSGTIDMQDQFLSLAGNKPVIVPLVKRILHKTSDGGQQYISKFDKWMQLKEIKVIVKPYTA